MNKPLLIFDDLTICIDEFDKLDDIKKSEIRKLFEYVDFDNYKLKLCSTRIDYPIKDIRNE